MKQFQRGLMLFCDIYYVEFLLSCYVFWLMICNMFQLNDIFPSLPSVLCFLLCCYSDTYFLVCMYLSAMIWIDATNMFVKHDVVHVQDQRKTLIHINCFGMIKTKKGEIVGSKSLKTWRLVLGSFSLSIFWF